MRNNPIVSQHYEEYNVYIIYIILFFKLFTSFERYSSASKNLSIFITLHTRSILYYTLMVSFFKKFYTYNHTLDVFKKFKNIVLI